MNLYCTCVLLYIGKSILYIYHVSEAFAFVNGLISTLHIT